MSVWPEHDTWQQIWSGAMNDIPTVGKDRRQFAHDEVCAIDLHRPSRHLLRNMIVAAVLMIAILAGIASYIEQWLWMRQLDYVGVFWTLFSAQAGMFTSAFVFAFLYLWINLRQVNRNGADFSGSGQAGIPAVTSTANGRTQPNIRLSPGLLKMVIAAISAGIALIFAVRFYAEWDTYLRFRYGGSFGVSDPLFGVDVGFYVFHLPFYILLQSSLTLLTVLTLLMVVLAYAFLGLLRVNRSVRISADGHATSHLSVLLSILAGNFAWGFYLNHYELVYSTLGVVYGAGYAADHVTRVILWMMVGISALACALLAVNSFRPRFNLLALASGAGAYLILSGVAVWLVPFAFQKLFVQPSELTLETPYLKNYIGFTRKGVPAGCNPGDDVSSSRESDT